MNSIHVLENDCISNKLDVNNAISDIREYAELFCMSITEAYEDMIDDFDLNDYNRQLVKDNLYNRS